MPRYFLEVAYMGTNYSGFQVQQNANTIQAEVTLALKTIYRTDFQLTGSSRTDAGVHAVQNFFHFDIDVALQHEQLYNINSLLPHDIVIKKIFTVQPDAHCRFDAVARTYHYYITRSKNPFLYGRAYYYPYNLNIELLQSLAVAIKQFKDFTSFSKRHTQVNHFLCNIESSEWIIQGDMWKYEITGDRFLRGMVKALAGTMLRLAKNNEDIFQLQKIIESKDCTNADFSAPPHGLFLNEVKFNSSIFL
ncbi:MAG: tRNA pseudouridine(38-40) synthase TruA [Parafilimonas sp.]